MFSLRRLLFVLVVLPMAALHAAPPADPAARKLYDHCRSWLINYPAGYIATNIRGAHDHQYVERRQAALDLLREKRDFGTVYDLMVELNNGGFLSESIIDLLVEWKSKRAIPLLNQIAQDKKRSKSLRAKAQSAAETLVASRPDARPQIY